MIDILDCITTEHDLRLVGLAAAICALGCVTTLTLLARAQVASASRRMPWLTAAAGIFGCGVWSMHFVAMLAFMPGLNIAYRVDLTAASILVAFGGALASFLVWRSPWRPLLRVLASGLLLGLGVTGMHYVGVAAMRFSGFVLFDEGRVAVSVVVSVVLSALAMARGRDLARIGRRVETTGWLALAICGLHFTGMTAITIAPGTAADGDGVVLGTSTLAVAVGMVSVMLLLASLAAVLMEQHLSQRALQELSRMRLLSNLAHEVLLIHRDGRLIEINDAGERLFGTSADALVGQPLPSLFAPDSLPALLRRSICPVADRRPEEMEIRDTNGTHVPVEISCQPIEHLGRPATALALRDLTDRKRDEARIRHLARHDALTSLPNRYNLQERLDVALEAARHARTALAVLYIDLDRFKTVNDLYGHAAGDALLVQVSTRALAEIQPADTLARIGGDEFVMVLQTGADPGRASTVAARVVEALGRPFDLDGHVVEIGAFLGIAVYPGDGANVETLLRAADTAMYRAKDEGRGSVRFFEASMNAHVHDRLQLQQELGHAIGNDELLLHFQPIANGTTGDIETFEALIRWHHPKRGLIAPIDFIPFAEESGLITPIGAWVIDAACRAAAGWPNPWRVSINVSPSQFRRSDICGLVAAALARNGLDPSRVVIEVTESVLMVDADKAVRILKRLRDMGIRLALDDFGTGFSSLSYLQRFKFDTLKIDRSFVRKLGRSEDSLTIVRTIINLGHNLGLHVTAEGVETPRQLAVLQSLGCDHIQGYLVARPGVMAPSAAPSTGPSMGTSIDLDRARVRALFDAGRTRLSA